MRDTRSVDEAANALRALGVDASEPRFYPEYTSDYYATFFHDLDGIELEIVNRLEARDDVVINWDSYPIIGE